MQKKRDYSLTQAKTCAILTLSTMREQRETRMALGVDELQKTQTKLQDHES